MMPDQANDQTKQANVYRLNRYKYFYIYYAHPISLYNTDQESLDLEFLENIKHVLNPKDINERGMSVFINFTQYAKEVWYRGYTAGVCLEVIIALLKHIPVYSLKTRLPISVEEQIRIIESYRKSNKIDHDLYLLSDIFGKSFAYRFVDFVDGDFP